MTLRTAWLTDFERFAALAPEWEDLTGHAGLPFSTHAWVRCWWEAFGMRHTVAICTLWNGAELAGGFPLVRRGRLLRAMVNEHTPIFEPVARDRAALGRLTDAVLSHGAQIMVPQIPADGAVRDALRRASRERRRRLLVEPEATSLIVDTSGDLGAYRTRMKHNFREIERRRRKAEREHVARWRLVEPPEDMDAELEAGLRVEASGWKGRGQTAIASDPHVLRFYRAIAAAFQERGELRFSSLTLDGELVAFDFALLRGGRYWLLKTAYDESHARLGPGMALRLAVVERCFEIGLDAHEFLGVDMEWKRRFATAERRLVTARSYGTAPAPAAQLVYRARLRPALKRLRDDLRRRIHPGV